MNRRIDGPALALVASIGLVWATAPAASPATIAMQEYDEVLTLTPNPDRGRATYRVCAVCHSPEGWGSPDGRYPQIAGQLRTVLIKQLADIRARNRSNPLMYPFTLPRMLGGTQQIADVTAYVASLPMTPNNGLGPGDDLEHGEALYRKECADCHGESGEGDKKQHIPALWAQHYNYLMRQFHEIKTGKRRNADEEMRKQIARFSERDIRAVMDYTSRLRPPADKLVQNSDWRNPHFPSFVRPQPPQPPRPPRMIAPGLSD